MTSSAERTRADPHGIHYAELPKQWAEGLTLGNGEVGVMCWSDGKRLRFTLDTASAWDLRTSGKSVLGGFTYDKMVELADRSAFGRLNAALDEHAGDKGGVGPTKVYLGRMDLDTEFDSCSELRLALDTAAVHGELRAGDRAHRLDAFVSRNSDVFCLRIAPWPDGAELTFTPFYETSPGLAPRGYPPLQVSKVDGLTVALQQISPDAAFALCWNAGGQETLVSIATAKDESEARRRALAGHPFTSHRTFDDLSEAHRKAWAEFWGVSDIALPETDMDFLWHFGLYTLAGCARKGSYPPGLQGVWAMDGRVAPWSGQYVVDMNVQETFWPAYAAGHLEAADVWLDYVHRLLPKAEEITRRVFGTRGAFQPCGFPELTPPGSGGGWWPTAFALSHTGWLAQLAWQRWRYSMDPDWLRRRGYPIVRSAFELYSGILREEADGFYHVPLSGSPEYDGPAPSAWCIDPNIDLALIRKCCDWLVEMEAALQRPELTPRAREIRERLVGYHLLEFDHPASYVRSSAPKGERVLALWKDKPLDYSHRHPSHLMAIHPAMDLTIDGAEQDREIVDASLRHYLSLGQYCWAGHTYVQMVSLAAVVGKAEMAYSFLRRYRDDWTLPNGLHFNRQIGEKGNTPFSLAREDISDQGQFTINETTGITCGISDMLLQGWGDRIRLFPATPAAWQDALFVDLLTEGAFRVSALRKKGAVCWVRITAGVDRPCRLLYPFGKNEFRTDGCTPERDGDDLNWSMAQGQTVALFTPGHETVDLADESRRIRSM